MGSVGLTLPWEHKLSSVARDGERRVEHFEGQTEPIRTSEELPQDAAIAAACLSGNLQGYEHLYQWQGTRMKNLARNLLGSQSDAEDAVQETFLKIQRSICGFRGQSSFVTWTFRILVNTCHDLRRSRLRRKDHANEDVDALPQRMELRAPGAHPSLRRALERALAKITAHQRDVFLLYEVEGFRHAEIARYTLTARTSFGRIKSELPITTRGQVGGDSLTGRAGNGACTLALTNSNGSIELLKLMK